MEKRFSLRFTTDSTDELDSSEEQVKDDLDLPSSLCLSVSDISSSKLGQSWRSLPSLHLWEQGNTVMFGVILLPWLINPCLKHLP